MTQTHHRGDGRVIIQLPLGDQVVGGVAVVHAYERMHYVSFPEYCVLLDLKEILINEIRLRDGVLGRYVYLLDHVPHMRPVRCHGPPLYSRKLHVRRVPANEKKISVGDVGMSCTVILVVQLVPTSWGQSLRWGDRRLLTLLGRRRFIYFVNNSATTI